jgi:hypothetical protein
LCSHLLATTISPRRNSPYGIPSARSSLCEFTCPLCPVLQRCRNFHVPSLSLPCSVSRACGRQRDRGCLAVVPITRLLDCWADRLYPPPKALYRSLYFLLFSAEMPAATLNPAWNHPYTFLARAMPLQLELNFPYHLPTHFIRSLAWLQSVRVAFRLGFNEACCCTAGPVSKGGKGIGRERVTSRNDQGMEGGTDDCIVLSVLSH